jgi:hypothetical protein
MHRVQNPRSRPDPFTTSHVAWQWQHRSMSPDRNSPYGPTASKCPCGLRAARGSPLSEPNGPHGVTGRSTDVAPSG